MARHHTFDYVIVGAGSAGCVLAHRLSADGTARVLLIEAGPSDRSLYIRMPSGVGALLNSPRFNWCFSTEPEAALGGRRVFWPRGRVLGGSSSINGMAYVRGHALDYAHWASLGLAGWSYAEVLPYFKRAETFVSGPGPYRGTDGPLFVTRGAARAPLYQAFIEAGREAGHPVTEDQNGYQQEGFGAMDMTIYRGKRCSAASAYLAPAARRGNLTIRLRALALRVLIERGRAVGVEYADGRGSSTRAMAAREVILAAGVINSPQLLMLSGIGEADELKRQGIAPCLDLPGVGRNLQDHPELYVQYECLKPLSLHDAFRFDRKLKIGLEWLLFRSGLGASNHSEAGAFIRSEASLEQPDIQYHFVPMAFTHELKAPLECHSFQAHVSPLRPLSRGRIALASADPAAPPRIEANYLAALEDRALLRMAVERTRAVFAQRAFEGLRGREIAPGPEVRGPAELDEWISQTLETAYHPCGTAKMGHDEMAVVDESCRVRGIEALRVVDASVMPRIVSGNLNAPVIMIAEKVSDLILGKPPLPREDLPYYRVRGAGGAPGSARSSD